MIYDIQKASILKRFSAFLLDFILLCVLAAGFMLFLSWATGMDGYTETLRNYYTQYGEEYNVDFNISSEDYNKLTDEEKAYYNEVYQKIFTENADAYKAYQMTTTLPLMIVSFSLLFAFLLLEFVVPLCLKNGQTVGKKVFSLGVVFSNGVRITTFALFVRNIFGKYTVETMVPLALVMMVFLYRIMGIVGLVVAAAIYIFDLILFVATKNKTFIHDIVSDTVVVNLQNQMIFATTAELVAYKEKIHMEEVAEKRDY